MKLLHTSPNKITNINKNGMFDDCLFFSIDEYVMTTSKTIYVYSLELSRDDLIDCSDLHNEEVIKNICDVLDVDEDAAERMLDGRDTAFDYGKDGDDDWWIQAKQGECAKKMGYKGCVSSDEQGAVYIVPMFDIKNRLVLERVYER